MSLTPYVHLDAPLATLGADAVVPLSPDEQHHLGRVLRLRDGAKVEVADGNGNEAPAVVTAGGVRLVRAPIAQPPRRPRLVVAQALAKGRKVDDVVRVVTELDVDAIVPVAAARSVVRLDDQRAGAAVRRWEAVARAASEQARRPTRPQISSPVPTDAVAALAGTVLVAHPGARPLPQVVAEVARATGAGGDDTAETLVLAVGPEGGFTHEEVGHLTAAGAELVGLGPTVLRTEHAAAIGLAVLAAGVGRWDEP